MCAISELQLLASVQIGPKAEELRTTRHRVVNKIIWLIGTSRNALLVVICGLLGWRLQNQLPVRLIGNIRHTYMLCKIHSFGKTHFARS